MWPIRCSGRPAKVTLTYALMLVPALYVSGLGLALLVQRGGRFEAVMRSLFFAPQMVSLVVVALVWQVLLVDKIGLGARALGLVGIAAPVLARRPELGALTVVLVSVWFLMGFYMLIFLGGLQDIPREYYEAAKIDGARAWTSLLVHHAAAAEADELLRAARFDGDGGGRRPGLRPDLRDDQGRAGELDLSC